MPVVSGSVLQGVGAQDEAPKAPRTRRRRRRGGGECGRKYPPPHPTRGLGSVVSSPCGVWDGAPAKNEFGAFYLSQNPSGGRKNNPFIDNYSGTNK